MTQTILVTGATGYIAKHIVLKLLERGDTVVGSVRNLSRDGELRDAMRAHLSDPAKLDNLRCVALNLEDDAGWDAAMEGVDAVLHTASPAQTEDDDEDALIRAGVDGALRALHAAKAAGVSRVVMTSSSVAVTLGNTPPDGRAFTEADWSATHGDEMSAHGKSKTLAEWAAWDFVAGDGAGLALTTINPASVMGAPLDKNYGSSVDVIERILATRDPTIPAVGFQAVDVRDVAEAHLRALDTPASIGLRIIATDRFLWFSDIAHQIKSVAPGRKIVTRVAPTLMIRLLAVFNADIKAIVSQLGRREELSNALAREVLGMEFRDVRESVREAAVWLMEETGA